MSTMEQYILKLPDSIREKMKIKIETNQLDDVECIAGANNNSFKFKIDGDVYPASLVPLPCIIESHKTFDDALYFKSGDISQLLIVYENDEERAKDIEFSSGITPPATNISKRKYAKTRKRAAFPKEEVARVEEDLVKLMQGGVVEDIQEELVEFQEWMVNEKHPNGITILNEMEYIKRNPKYLEVVRTSSPIKVEKESVVTDKS